MNRMKDAITVRGPEGFKAKMEKLRKKLGYRSLNELAYDLLTKGVIPKTEKS